MIAINQKNDQMDFADGFWVFGYGSLMWKAGFEFTARRKARLEGYHRRFCLDSITYRGTPENPGLVLGLDEGGMCEGIAYQVAASVAEETYRYLHDREMSNYSYREEYLPILLEPFGESERVPALCYVMDPAHPRYAGGLDLTAQAERIARCAGPMGPNAEYLHNTMDHLREMKASEPELEELERMVRELGSEPN